MITLIFKSLVISKIDDLKIAYI